MRASRTLRLVVQNVARNRASFLFATVGILVGTALFVFFLGLVSGVRERVINRIFPINQLELEPRTVRVFGVQGSLGEAPVDDARVKQLAAIPGVVRAFPKQRAKHQARLWGGKPLLGYDLFTEAFFDGIAPELLVPELRDQEDGDRRMQKARGASGRLARCDEDVDCPPGNVCEAGQCKAVVWSDRFRDEQWIQACTQQDECVSGSACLAGRCERLCNTDAACTLGESCLERGCRADADCVEGKCAGGKCERGMCGRSCDPKAIKACEAHEHCVALPATGLAPRGRCEGLPCKLVDPKAQMRIEPTESRGVVPGRCADGRLATDSPGCLPMACPGSTYCAPRNPSVADGVCERPLPGVINPFILEVFNTDMATSLGVQRVAGREALYGLRFQFILGDSYFAQDESRDRQSVKQVQVIGFSDKAPEFGVTLPASFVAKQNARYKGREEAGRFDTVIVETTRNEEVPNVTAEASRMGFELSRKSKNAKMFGTVLFVLALTLTFISVVVMVVSAVNITHTFLMVVYERRKEIAVLRAIGATRWEIRALVLLEAAFIGLCGAIMGCLTAYGLSRAVNAGAAQVLTHIPYAPSDLFLFPPWVFAAALGFGVLFGVAGAFVPSGRAARLDPAEVMSQA